MLCVFRQRPDKDKKEAKLVIPFYKNRPLTVEEFREAQAGYACV